MTPSIGRRGRGGGCLRVRWKGGHWSGGKGLFEGSVETSPEGVVSSFQHSRGFPVLEQRGHHREQRAHSVSAKKFFNG